MFSESYGDGSDSSYVKVKEIEQNVTGDRYACAFYENGLFKLRVFGDENRSAKEIEDDEVCFNDML